jgi:hypothetical protein
MKIAAAIKEYIQSEDFFAPDYEQDAKILYQFKKDSPALSDMETRELIKILKKNNQWPKKFFAADLLYLYDSFDIEILDPLIENAIIYPDVSFNRIFLRPALRVFGTELISEILAQKFVEGDIIRKIRISSLVYWIEREDNSQTKKLEDAIVKQAKKTDNIIELYYYNRYFPDKVGIEQRIPNNANELIEAINGNAELEDILYNRLGWIKPNSS